MLLRKVHFVFSELICHDGSKVRLNVLRKCIYLVCNPCLALLEGSQHCLIPCHLCHRHPGLYLAPGLRLQEHQAHPPKHKVAVKREGAVTKETTKKLADDKKIIKKEKDEKEVSINEYLD